jgi:hypothetical protein
VPERTNQVSLEMLIAAFSVDVHCPCLDLVLDRIGNERFFLMAQESFDSLSNSSRYYLEGKFSHKLDTLDLCSLLPCNIKLLQAKHVKVLLELSRAFRGLYGLWLSEQSRGCDNV